MPVRRTAPAQDPEEILNVAGIARGRWAPYRNARTGLTLSYPSHWKLSEAPEKGTLFKIDSRTCSLGFGIENSPGMPVRQAARLWENLVLSQLKDYKLLSSNRIRIGQNHSLQGYSFVFQFSAGNTTVKQRWIFFGQTGSVYHAILSIPINGSRQDIPDVYRILSTITFTGGASSSQTPVAAAAIQPWSKLSLYQEGPSTVSYPSEWQVIKHPEPDVLVKFSGKNADGAAEIGLRRSGYDPNLTLENVAGLVETHILKQLKNYRRLRHEQVSLGGGAVGILQEFTFDINGLPFRQISVYRREGDHLYTFSLLTNGWKPSDMLTLFNRCLGTWSIRE